MAADQSRNGGTLVKDYLTDKQRDGDFESTGHFSCDAIAAHQKLGLHLLSSSSFYLLKFVQAAVQAQCSKVDFEIRRREVVVRLCDWQGDLPFQALLEGALGPLSGTTLEQQIFAGYVGLGSLKPERLTVQWPGAKATVVAGEATIERSQGGDDICLRAQFSNRSVRQVQEELHTIAQRCQFCPIPVLLNQRQVTVEGPPSSSYKPLWNCYLPHNYVLAHKEMEEPTGTVYLRIGLRRQAELSFLQHGVTIQTLKVPFPVPGIEAVIQADQLQTDLSGFQIVEDEARRQVMARILMTARELKETVLEELESLEASQAPFSLSGTIKWRKSVSGTGLGIVGTGVALMAFTGDLVLGTFLIGSPLLLCASVASASLAGAPVFAPDEACHLDLREQIRRRLSLGGDESPESPGTTL